MGVVSALARILGIDEEEEGGKYKSKAWINRRARYYGKEGHAHICRACLWQIILHLLTLGRWESKKIELHHRVKADTRYKMGKEPAKALCPLCDNHHGESDALRRTLESFGLGGRFTPMITAHRIYLVTQYIEQVVVTTIIAGISFGVWWMGQATGLVSWP